MNHHYLRNLPIEVLLANAGYSAKHWQGYVLPRSRNTSIDDEKTKRLIEFFYPELYAKAHRAKQAFEGAPIEADDAASTTNFRFLANLREITFFWLQDAVVLLSKIPELAGEAPWKTLLEAEHLQDDFRAFGSLVTSAMHTGDMEKHDKLLEQADLLHSVRSGAVQGAHLLDSRLATLPQEVSSLTYGAWHTNALPLLGPIFHTAMREFFRQVGEMPLREQEELQSTAPDGGPSNSDDDDDDGGDGGGGVDDTQDAAASNTATQGAATQRAATQRAATQRAATQDAATQRAATQGAATQGAATQGAANQESSYSSRPCPRAYEWRPPPVPAVPAVPASNGVTRKPPPPPASLKTGPRPDGFYLGNDIDSVRGVWELRNTVENFITEQFAGDKQQFWGVTEGSKQEKQEQSRLRARRRLVWDAINEAAKVDGIDAEEVVNRLQSLQSSLQAGISRIETWANEAKKAGCTIIKKAEEYAKQKQAGRSRTSQI